jgi:hypothetical protein
MITETIVYPCGCESFTHETGILRSHSKCEFHTAAQRRPQDLGEDYYEELAKIGSTHHVDEIREALGPFPVAVRSKLALEIGPGVSQYVKPIQEAGWKYHAVDASSWACRHLRVNHGAIATVATIEQFHTQQKYDFLLCAHVLEHLEDAPRMLVKMNWLTEPGAECWIIVPDDSDPVNPDHLWFFTEATLADLLEASGFHLDKIATYQHIAREKFVYARATSL